MQTRTAIQIKKTIIENGSKVSSAKEKAKEQAKASRREEKVRGEGGESGNNSWQSDSSPGIRTWQHRLLAMASQNALPPKPNVLKRLDPKCLDPSTN